MTKAIVKNDQDAATEAKSVIEQAQRDSRAEREASDQAWDPKHFTTDETTGLWTCVYSKTDFADPKAYAAELDSALFKNFDPRL